MTVADLRFKDPALHPRRARPTLTERLGYRLWELDGSFPQFDGDTREEYTMKALAVLEFLGLIP